MRHHTRKAKAFKAALKAAPIDCKEDGLREGADGGRIAQHGGVGLGSEQEDHGSGKDDDGRHERDTRAGRGIPLAGGSSGGRARGTSGGGLQVDGVE